MKQSVAQPSKRLLVSWLIFTSSLLTSEVVPAQQTENASTLTNNKTVPASSSSTTVQTPSCPWCGKTGKSIDPIQQGGLGVGASKTTDASAKKTSISVTGASTADESTRSKSTATGNAAGK